ncbi:unnamed protein product [Alopecurus aequalis]
MRMCPASQGGMSSTSSVRSSIRRRAVPVPIIECPDCGEPVKQWVSNTDDHDGWVFYSCRNHGKTCDFWKWELKYVEYLIDQRILVGDDAPEAFCAAEEKGCELKKMREAKAKYGTNEDKRGKIIKRNGPALTATGDSLTITKLQADAMLAVGREIVVMMKFIVATVLVLCVLCLALILKK